MSTQAVEPTESAHFIDFTEYLRIGSRWGDQHRVRCPICQIFISGVESATCGRCGTVYVQVEKDSLHYRVVS